MLTTLKQFYEKQYKLLLIIPFVLLLIAFIQIGVQASTTGDFVNKGVSLKGGSTIILPQTELNTISEFELESNLLSLFPNAELAVRTISSATGAQSLIIESNLQNQDEINSLTSSIEQLTSISLDSFTVEVMGSSLGESFFKQTMIALLIAFLLMGIVVFIYFRNPVPSLAVILAAFSDIVITVSIFNLTGMKLSTAGIAALLMLIGYSVDTDILVTTHLLKKRRNSSTAEIMRSIYSAMKTGLTMSMTTIIVLIITLFLVQSEVVKQIVVILLIGLLIDLIMTWIQNVGILRLYLEKKYHKKHPTHNQNQQTTTQQGQHK